MCVCVCNHVIVFYNNASMVSNVIYDMCILCLLIWLMYPNSVCAKVISVYTGVWVWSFGPIWCLKDTCSVVSMIIVG